jgi:hypothetical protein
LISDKVHSEGEGIFQKNFDTIGQGTDTWTGATCCVHEGFSHKSADVFDDIAD